MHQHSSVCHDWNLSAEKFALKRASSCNNIVFLACWHELEKRHHNTTRRKKKFHVWLTNLSMHLTIYWSAKHLQSVNWIIIFLNVSLSLLPLHPTSILFPFTRCLFFSFFFVCVLQDCHFTEVLYFIYQLVLFSHVTCNQFIV